MYKTVSKYAESLDVIKKSKFIGYIKPIETVEEAQSFIAEIKKKHWDANHNVPIYVLGDKFQVQKASDDGEPSGTAGVPVLNILKNEGITDVVIVITRYFGGTKLGTGGLVRAYSQSAKSVLSLAQVIEKITYQEIALKMHYTLHGKVQNYLMQHPEYFMVDTLYTDDVEVRIYVELSAVDQFKNHLIDLTHDQVNIKNIEEKVLSISEGKWLGGVK